MLSFSFWLSFLEQQFMAKVNFRSFSFPTSLSVCASITILLEIKRCVCSRSIHPDNVLADIKFLHSKKKCLDFYLFISAVDLVHFDVYKNESQASVICPLVYSIQSIVIIDCEVFESSWLTWFMWLIHVR